ncbi:MAG: VF530 family protein [Pseudobdellovibrio sp.]
MSKILPKNLLEGITLETILKTLVEHYGWQHLGEEITVNCFNNDPSITSSLKFLRKTPWARAKVEQMYIRYLKEAL